MRKLMAGVMILGVTALVFAGGETEAQPSDGATYPTKEIVLVVPFGPGGSTDTGARLFARVLAEYLPVEVVVTNVAGAAGTIAAEEIKAVPPDGYRLLVTYAGYPVPNIMGNTDLSYRDFRAVGQYLAMDTCVVLSAEGEYRDLDDLIEAARAEPGEIKFGAGFGTLAYFGALALEQAAGVDFNIVDIGGGVPKAPELLGGRIAAYFDPMSSVAQYIASGQFIGAGIYAEERNPLYPDIPTMREQGYEIVLNQQSGLWAPADTPDEVIATLNEAMEHAIADPALAEELNAVYASPYFRDGAEYTEYLADEFENLAAFGRELR